MPTTRLRWLACAVLVGTGSLGGLAFAEPAASEAAAPPERVEWGFGAQVRRSHMSLRVQKFFVGDSPGPATQDGVGVVFTRRVERVEIVFGLGYDRLDGRDGYYLDLGGDPTAPGKVDHVDFRKLSWFTAEITAVGRVRLHQILALRYGAGLGIGLVRGEIRKTDALCTGADLERDCVLDPAGMQVDEPADVPPVLPVVNVLLGVELRPVRRVAVHLDVGLHTVPYVGAGMTLYLW
jgi:hypothetical protein